MSIIEQIKVNTSQSQHFIILKRACNLDNRESLKTLDLQIALSKTKDWTLWKLILYFQFTFWILLEWSYSISLKAILIGIQKIFWTVFVLEINWIFHLAGFDVWVPVVQEDIPWKYWNIRFIVGQARGCQVWKCQTHIQSGSLNQQSVLAADPCLNNFDYLYLFNNTFVRCRDNYAPILSKLIWKTNLMWKVYLCITQNFCCLIVWKVF